VDVSPIQIIIVLAIVLLVFGARRLPEIGRGLGGGMRGFRDSLTGRHRATGPPGDDISRAAPAEPPGTDPPDDRPTP
jgi:sec-independent protein translocase protein TatA